MKLRFLLIFFLIAGSFILSSCFGAWETDDVSYIMAIGVDKGKDGKLIVTYQIALSKPSSDGGQESSMETTWTTASIAISSPAESRMLINSIIPRTPLTNHLVAFIFSEEVAREGINPSISYLIRDRNFRESIYLIVARGAAADYINRNKPSLEPSIAKYYESLFASSRESGYYLPTTLHTFYARLKNPGGSPYLAYSGINPLTGADYPAEGKTFEQKGEPYLPGGIPRKGTSDNIDFIGLALFRGDKMIGALNSDETRAVAILQGTFETSTIGVVDPLETKDTINIRFKSSPKAKISVELIEGQPVFNVDVQIEAENQGISSGIHYEAPYFRHLLENQIANLITEQINHMIRHTQELGSDPVGFGLYLRSLFKDTEEMQNASLTEYYQAARINVRTTVKMRREGLQHQTTPDKKG